MDPHFGAPHNVKFYLLYLFTLKISYVQPKRLKSLNLGGPRVGELSFKNPQFFLGLYVV